MGQHPYYISWSKQNNASTFEITGANGVWVKSRKDGSAHDLIDMSSISYQAHFGHTPKIILDEINQQLYSIPLSSPKGVYPKKDKTTSDLLNYMKKPDGKIFYTTGGAETIENALKIARQITKRKIVLARKNSYHGATLGALAVTGDWRNPAHLTPSDWVYRIPEPHEDPNLSKTEEIIRGLGKENIAAIILETITGGNGVIIPDPSWWKKMSEIATNNKILLIMDEVVCGFERTGKAFGYEHYDVNPDMICLAKGISGGVIPFGALWTSKQIADYYEDETLVCGLTNYAHPLGIAALRGVLKIIHTEEFQKTLSIGRTLFKKRMEKLQTIPGVTTIRVAGHLAAIETNSTISAKEFFNEGLYLVAQEKRVILAPPLVINEHELNIAMDRIENVLKRNLKA